MILSDKNITLSILIVNYNGRKYLQDCFDSIYKKCASINFEIIVVDNNSTDKSVVFIEENYPEINLIKSSENLGFAKGNNLAAKHAKGEFLLLLNNDTILLDNIEPAISILKNDTTIGAVGIKMLDKNKNLKKSTGKFPNLLSLVFFSKLYYSKKTTEKLIDVDWIEASLLLTTRDVFNAVNGFSKDYFMYVEDVDFSKKIALLDKRRCYFSDISYIHFGGFNKSKHHLLIKGYKIYVQKHFKSYKRLGVFVLNLKELIFKSFTKR